MRLQNNIEVIKKYYNNYRFFFRRNKIIFVHIPKTAGTSIRSIVEQEYGQKNCLYIYYQNPDFFFSIRNRLPRAKVIYGHFSYGIHDILGIHGRYITFLRDPVKRVISYFNHQSLLENSEYFEEIKRGMTLKEMLQGEFCHQLNNHMVRIISGYHDTSMTFDENILKKAIYNIDKHFVFVGVAENLSDSLSKLSKKMNWKKPYQIPYYNDTPESTKIKLNDEMLNIIKKYNNLDIKLYEWVRKSFSI